MKIKTRKMDYEEVMARPMLPEQEVKHPNRLMWKCFRFLSLPELRSVNFKWKVADPERMPREPALILMNHSAFIDLKIAVTCMYPMRFHIVVTSDGVVGKSSLMRGIGCIPTPKFIYDVSLILKMRFALQTLKESVLLFPEASYSFDGTATTMPERFGRLIKMLKVPVIFIRTEGAFAHDPLYNELRKRKVDVSATVSCLLTADEAASKSEEEITSLVMKQFQFDHFAWQKEHGVRITEPTRANGLQRVLYKCPVCLAEGKMTASGTRITCEKCGSAWEMDELGEMHPVNCEAGFSHVPDWYAWERKCVREEIETGSYKLDIPVDISMTVDESALYEVGTGRLQHDITGFHLTGCGGRLDYTHDAILSYSLYVDYYWYEKGDIICIGQSMRNRNILYYCFPQNHEPVAKVRLAAEEIYKKRKHEQKTG